MIVLFKYLTINSIRNYLKMKINLINIWMTPKELKLNSIRNIKSDISRMILEF